MADGTIAVHHELQRSKLPAFHRRPDPGSPIRTQPDPGRTRGEMRTASYVHRLGRARRTKRLDSEPSADRSSAEDADSEAVRRELNVFNNFLVQRLDPSCQSSDQRVLPIRSSKSCHAPGLGGRRLDSQHRGTSTTSPASITDTLIALCPRSNRPESETERKGDAPKFFDYLLALVCYPRASLWTETPKRRLHHLPGSRASVRNRVQPIAGNGVQHRESGKVRYATDTTCMSTPMLPVIMQSTTSTLAMRVVHLGDCAV